MRRVEEDDVPGRLAPVRLYLDELRSLVQLASNQSKLELRHEKTVYDSVDELVADIKEPTFWQRNRDDLLKDFVKVLVSAAVGLLIGRYTISSDPAKREHTPARSEQEQSPHDRH
jgi:hypothetical protein